MARNFWISRGFRIGVVLMNALLLAMLAMLPLIPDGSKVMDVSWFALTLLQFGVPILSIFALLYYPPEPAA